MGSNVNSKSRFSAFPDEIFAFFPTPSENKSNRPNSGNMAQPLFYLPFTSFVASKPSPVGTNCIHPRSKRIFPKPTQFFALPATDLLASDFLPIR